MRNLLGLVTALACLGALPGSRLLGQAAESRISQASREQLQQTLAEAEKIISSPGYSGRIKDMKRKEIALLKSRLDDGDLQPGDQVVLAVLNESTLTGNFVVSPSRTLALPGIPDISVRGLLRSEVQDFMSTELKKYIKNPTVTAQTTIRLSVLGGVGRPGYYQLPAQELIDSAIMTAGGPNGGVDPSKSRIERNRVEVLSKDGFRQALIDGRTLDQLNLRAGDEILVGGVRTVSNTRGLMGVLPYVGLITSLSYLAVRVF